MSKRSVTLKKYQKYLTGAVFQKVCSKIFLQIVIIFFLFFFFFAEFIFSKITCFQLFILGIQTTFRLEKPQCKNFWWEDIKNESRKVIKNKKQKSMFLVVSRSVFFRALLGVQVKKIGSVEINLSNSIL